MEMWAQAEHKREEAFLKYQERQADLNRQHELRLMEIMVRSQNPIQQQLQLFAQGYSQQYSQYPEAVFSTGFHEVSSQEPHITNLDSYNRQGTFNTVKCFKTEFIHGNFSLLPNRPNSTCSYSFLFN